MDAEIEVGQRARVAITPHRLPIRGSEIPGLSIEVANQGRRRRRGRHLLLMLRGKERSGTQNNTELTTSEWRKSARATNFERVRNSGQWMRNMCVI